MTDNPCVSVVAVGPVGGALPRKLLALSEVQKATYLINSENLATMKQVGSRQAAWGCGSQGWCAGSEDAAFAGCLLAALLTRASLYTVNLAGGAWCIRLLVACL